ncbi:MAG: MBL fold metallo-hydrolase [Paracoccaceae bacterium]|nr:MBL fold metallo-hydrolase [Nitrososphaerota archaeon]MDE2917349.1 MBL fold metallo-hydrolase [Paracoccaceae bacterium]
MKSTAITTAALTATIVMLMTTGPAAQAQAPTDVLSVTYIQLEGAGDSTLIQTPSQKTILIDGGLKRDYAGTIKPLLDEKGIDTIDLIIGTHKDRDHLNGINGLLEADQIPVNAIWFSPELSNTTTVTTPFYDSVERKNIPLSFPTTGDTSTIDADVHIEVLSPNQIRQFNDDNANSIVMLLEYGDIEFLFTGDATEDTESWLVANTQGDKLDIDIMNAPHHGSIGTSNTQAFIAATSPELVIFSADEDNRYGHPDEATVDRYEANNIDHLQTGTAGHINVQTDGIKCSILFANGTEVACFEGVSKLSEQTATPQQQQQQLTYTATKTTCR